MSKYLAITPWLLQFEQEVVTASFREIEDVIGGPLPASARTYRNWWGNLANPTQQPQKAWYEAGMRVAAVDLEGEMVTFDSEPVLQKKTWSSGDTSAGKAGRPPIMDGRKALLDLVSEVGERLAPFFARHAVFLHPRTVEQANGPEGDAIFPIVRARGKREPGDFVALDDGTEVMVDDNTAPTLAFLWAAQRTRGADVQFNHVWQASNDPSSYTALWNVMCTPAFLAKLTDTKDSEIAGLVRYHAWALYGRRPEGTAEPVKPAGYDSLEWAPHPKPVENLASVLQGRLESNKSQRAWKCAQVLGWRFGQPAGY